MIDILKPLIKQFLPFAQKRMGFQNPPKLFLKQDDENAKNPLGRTAHYNPAEKSITIYITGRHPKDVLRSLSHELVHHSQCCRGDLSSDIDTSAGYAQKDDHMREMEREAYEVGNMCFRDFEDGLKESRTIYYEHLQKGEKTMSTKDWKNKEITQLLSEAWGFKFNTLQEFDEFNNAEEIQEVSDQEGAADAEEETRGDATDSYEDVEESVSHPDADREDGRQTGRREKQADGQRVTTEEAQTADDKEDEKVNENDDVEELEESQISRIDEEMKKLLKKFLKR